MNHFAIYLPQIGAVANISHCLIADEGFSVIKLSVIPKPNPDTDVVHIIVIPTGRSGCAHGINHNQVIHNQANHIIVFQVFTFSIVFKYAI